MAFYWENLKATWAQPRLLAIQVSLLDGTEFTLMSLPKYLSGLGPRQLALVFFVIVFGGSCLVMSYLYVGAVRHREEDIRVYIRELAMAAAGLVDVELHEQLVRPEQLDSELYRQVLNPLVKFHLAHPSIQYVWTTRVAEDGRQWLVLETATEDRIRNQQASLGRPQDILSFLDVDPPTEAGSRSIPVLRSGKALVLDGIYADSHGEYIEARAPLQDHTGKFIGYVGVDYALDSYRKRINEVRLAGLVTLGLALAVSLLVALVMAEMRRQTFVHLRQAEHAEAEMRVQRDLADQASQAKSELLAIASHDLKNPLSAIAGMSGLMLKQKKRSDLAASGEDIEVLETIHASAQHMSEIVRGVLLNEGIESGGMEFHPTSVDLVKVWKDILRINAPAATRKQIQLRIEVPESLPVQADAKLLREAFDNYLSNAIKYSPPGGTVCVTLGSLPGEGMVEFAVRDEGQGLSTADQAMLFQKFKKLTPRPTAGESSTGLGLSIVKSVADRHGGSVGCESSPGQGARFWLRLPVVSAVAAL
jgi:signal transduction histidine kinase